MIGLFIVGFASFVAGCCLSYIPALKASPAYYPIWILITLFSTMAWAVLAKSIPDSSRLLVIGLYWDTLMQLTYLLMPLLIFGARLTLTQSAGAVLIFLGLLLTRG